MTLATLAATRTVLLLSRGQRHHYEGLHASLGGRCEETEDWSPEVVERVQPALLISLTTDWWEADACLRRAHEMRVPTLLLMDGLVEWRHQWEDPKNGAAEGVGLFLTTPADKIACLGRQSARLLEGWGNTGRCEVVGSPRFDGYLTRPVPPPPPGPRRLLVMTANTPGFTPDQIAQVEKSLQDLQRTLAAQTHWTPIWRVRGGLKERLGLTGTRPDLESVPLSEALAESHAVVTTPSTAQLEAFLAHRPTALLDYGNRPHYVPAAWRITSPDHLPPTLAELADAPRARMLYQEEILRDAVECQSPAIERLVFLVEEMVAIGERCRREGRDLEFPSRLLPVSRADAAPESFDPTSLYPSNRSFAPRQVGELQRSLALARQEAKTWRRRAELAASFRRSVRRLFGLERSGT